MKEKSVTQILFKFSCSQSSQMSIVAGLAFNTKTGQFKDCPLYSPEELGSVVDIFNTIERFDHRKPSNGGLARKVLQFLWRDSESPLQLIGPYFELESGVSTRALHSIVRDVVRSFHCFGLHTHIICCDGASAGFRVLGF
jgi:hypothetical protein